MCSCFFPLRVLAGWVRTLKIFILQELESWLEAQSIRVWHRVFGGLCTHHLVIVCSKTTYLYNDTFHRVRFLLLLSFPAWLWGGKQGDILIINKNRTIFFQEWRWRQFGISWEKVDFHLVKWRLGWGSDNYIIEIHVGGCLW